MNANVDKDTCIGCGLCVGIEPDVFQMNDEDGKAEAYQEATDDNKSSVDDAINSCPVAAIAWE